jgi:MYXO-CTERM domain-containing protein
VTFKVTAMADTATVQLTFAAGGATAPTCLDGTAPPATPMCGNVVTGGGMDGGAGRGGAGGAGGAGGSAGGSGGRGVDGGTGGAGGTSMSGSGGNGGMAGSGVGGTGPGGSTSGGAAGATPTSTSVGAGGSSVGSGPANGSAAQDSGCGCRVPGREKPRPSTQALLLTVAMLLPWLRRARRQRLSGHR